MNDLHDGVVGLSNTLYRLHTTFNVDQHKVHMMGLLVGWWDAGYPVRVTDVLNSYEDVSRATAHRMVKELVSNKILKTAPCADDKRIKFLAPGQKFEAYAKAIGGK